MSSNKKNNKADFVAIYRLEFYKNKRNWKLGARGNTIETKTVQSTLNATYDVEEGSSLHLNDAFIDTASDADQTSKSKPESLKRNLSQQWLESINIWPSTTQKQKTNDSNDILQKLLSRDREVDVKLDRNLCLNCPGLEKEINDRVVELQSEYLPKRAEIRPRSINTNTTKSALSKDDARTIAELQAQYYGLEHAWPPEFNPVDVVDGADHRFLSSGFLSLQREFNLVEERMSSLSVDSFSEFSRGADLAPHASEIELADLHEELDANGVARMSSAQLAGAVQAHARRLALLLWESGERRKLRHSHSQHERMSVDSFPTHDMGPYRHDTTEFIAGSFPTGPRGRVVIEGGRPVRLHGDFV
ncbi:uncharacterized protein LOC123703918 isoform X2 [Colias croceus]|uniref:uncharacterized protein LOC123703918 isoform X2 n=1 Tax=Colias crocea TaxID=72248 RepID=UPI001E27BA29|nr:uncharacterized protein LOC123703918 isoform X2 [Colias croceus]